MNQINANAPTPDEIMELVRENERLQAQLAKANDRAAGLEKANNEYAVLIANLVRRSDIKSDLLENPTYEKVSDTLNKFAIEQQIKALKSCISENAFYDDFDTDIIYVDDLLDDIKRLESKI